MNAKLDELLKHLEVPDKQLVGLEQNTDKGVERAGERIRNRT